MKALAVLGSTGSIGRSTLAVVEAYPERFRVIALAAGRRLEILRPQIARHRPELVATARPEDAEALRLEFPNSRFVAGHEGLMEVASHPEAAMVVAAMVGSVGMQPTLAAITSGKDVALANKETLVVAGRLVMREVERCGVQLLPIDSEHNAIHQALRVGPSSAVGRLILTASGGPFRSWPAARLAEATVDHALAHPTWRMGAKISVDSATMMNKGLEIIEAHHLFAMPEDRIDILIHPQSLLHSLVEFVDGSLIAQLSVNDMRLPILYALSWPERLTGRLPKLDLAAVGVLSFESPDLERFPAPALARAALASGGEMPAVLNAANEVAVAAFLEGRCAFVHITDTAAAVMEAWQPRNRELETVEQALAADGEGRRLARERLMKYASGVGGSK
jgi:1-deoxy-D-xylulose-5-phosphate reductoisomerase